MKHRVFLYTMPLLLCLIAAVSAYFFLKQIPLVPEVNQDLFFAEDDPQLQSDKTISKKFGDIELTIVAIEGEIYSKTYQQKLSKLTNEVKKIVGVVSVFSLPVAVDNIQEAFESPLFRQILIANDKKSSNLVISTRDTPAKTFIANLEKSLEKYQEQNFKTYISGIPFIIENVRRELTEDLKTFTIASVLFFGIAILIIFKSLIIVLGALITCLSACILTLVSIHFMNIQVGVLTANIVTVVFILTLSHVVFLSHRNKDKLLRDKSAYSRVKSTLLYTISASCWSALTTSIAFALLITAEAKPLREFGITGVLGTFFGLITAYLIFPWFLACFKPSQNHMPHAKFLKNLTSKLSRPSLAISLVIAAIVLGFFASALNSDPPLPEYFDTDSQIYTGLAYVDKSGGSSPLSFVIKLPSFADLDSSEAYDKLWLLHQEIEKNPEVGSVLSLPLLMNQANKPLLAKLLPWSLVIDALEYVLEGDNQSPFITPDRKEALYFLRMRELNRERPRAEIINDLKATITKHGFKVVLVGGMYSLQAKMGKLLTSSLLDGLLKILPIFFLLGILSTRSIKLGCCLGLAVTVIPLIVLGTLGLFGISLDLASAPAANLAMALGIDEMFHFLHRAKQFKNFPRLTLDEWIAARDDLIQPILGSAFIVSSGFCMFIISNFPPTRRFGALVLIGTILAEIQALVSLPYFCRKFSSN